MRSLNRRRLGVAALLAVGLLIGAACTEEGGSDSQESVQDREERSINSGFDRLTQSQQVPQYDYSQERQTLIGVMTARAEGTHGTAVVYNLDGTIRWWCPTIGAPIPSTYQLTNPEQIVGGDGERTEEQVTPLGEPTGVYTGQSDATWILCLDDAGTPFGKYAEPDVDFTFGVVNGLPADRRAQVDEITFDFETADSEG